MTLSSSSEQRFFYNDDSEEGTQTPSLPPPPNPAEPQSQAIIALATPSFPASLRSANQTQNQHRS